MRPFSWLLLLVLVSKFYFLLGFQAGTRQPQAPEWLILFRDGIYFVFIGYLAFQIPWKQIKFFRPYLAYALLAVWGLLIALLHLGSKGAFETSQHYFRNGMLPTLAFPLSYFFFRSHPKFQFPWKQILVPFGLISLVLSLLQIFWLRHLMWQTRPTGILGDPLLNSSFLLFFLVALWSFDYKTWIRGPLSILILVAIYASSSLSAFAAFILSLAAAAIILSLQKQIHIFDWFRQRKEVFLWGAGFLVLFFVSMKSVKSELQLVEAFDQKAKNLWASVICYPDCDQQHWSVAGRLKSNLAAIEMCQASGKHCLFGDLSSAFYHRLDSTWSSLILNWGIFYCLLYLLTFLILPVLHLREQKFTSESDRFGLLIFLFFWFFGLFNTVIYKYPLNILFYVALGLLLSRNNKFSSETR